MPILEAMTAGCNIIASNVGCIPEMLKGRGTAVNDTGDDAFVDAIIYLHRNPTIKKYLSANARVYGMKQGYQSLVDEWISMFTH